MIAVIFIVAVLLWWYVNDQRKCAGFPPGPLRFPLVGNLPQIVVAAVKTRTPFEGFQKLSEKYGDVMHLRLGMSDKIMLSSHKSITKQFGMEMNNSRMLIDVLRDRNQNMNLGIIVSVGEVWETLRRFTIRGLREYGFGKSGSMDQMINDELGKLLSHLETLRKANDGVLPRMENIFDLATVNVVWRLVSGKDYELNDHRLQSLVNLNEEFASCATVAGISLAYPALGHYFPKLTARDVSLNCINKIKEFIQELIDEHKRTGTYSTNPQCFIDAFLAQIEMAEVQKSETSFFNETQLLYVLLDLFQAGSEATSRTMSFAILYVMVNPEVQKRIHDEIDKVAPANEPITSAMKSQMPFTAATILETYRCSSVFPVAGIRETDKDVLFGGYKIKTGVGVILNFHAAHHQKSLWGDPEVFRPDRFLTAEMRIDAKVADRIVGFGGGKRICLGKQLAESTIFIYFTSLLRKYEFKVPVGKATPTTHPRVGLTNTPAPFHAEVVDRGTRNNSSFKLYY